MEMGRKQKSSSPEPLHAKVAKKEAGSDPDGRLNFNPRKGIFTYSERKVKYTSSPRRHSAVFNCHHQETGNVESGLSLVQSSSSLESSAFQSEMDTELGLVIRLDEEGTWEPNQQRTTNGGKQLKRFSTDVDEELGDEDGDAEGADLDDSEDEFRKLDRDLTVKSKQHNLSSVHVRGIIHEVITNEHVVAMMKAAIRETRDLPMFEPKMTRSKLRDVVEKVVRIPNWNISPIKQSKEMKPPQFVDIPLKDEEDSSDEEYYPDEDEEDDTAEETLLESDMDSISSSPSTSGQACSCTSVELSECDEETSNSPRMRHLKVEAMPMGPPAPPSQSGIPSRPLRALDSFLEKLHAVDEELELSALCMKPYQALGSCENAEESLVACRTRSKRPLRDVSLDQLEAALNAPDITPDMYDFASSPEDKDWSEWLQGLMTSHLDNEEDGDNDDDDPEYNFLDDPDEPDVEDYRNDRAVRITKKEVNELMDELFEAFHEDLKVNEDEVQKEDKEQKKVSLQSAAKFNVPQAIRFEEPLAHLLTMCRRTVREQIDAVQQHQSRPHYNAPGPLIISPSCTLMVTSNQKCQLQQQIQQHVQLLTQVNMLGSRVELLQSQAIITKLFLTELQSFSERAEQMRAVVEPGFKSVFRVCNLQPSLDLLEELEKTAFPPIPKPKMHRYPLLPAHLSWLFATRSVFLYPELLPHCSLDPALQPPRSKTIYTKGEDGLIVLGLKHFSDTEFPYHLMSQYLIQTKRAEQLRARVKDMCSSKATDNIVKFYCQHLTVPSLPVACCPVVAGKERPPVEREHSIMPNWLLKSLPSIYTAVFQRQSEKRTASDKRTASPPPPTFPVGTQYPLSLPKGLTLRLHSSTKRQVSARYKPRPLHGFACPASKPLAKAPVCPTSTINLLTPVPAPLPSQAVILLAQSPLIPINDTLSVTQVTATPANETVPLNSVGPVNIQYIVPQQGCVNTVDPPSFPSASVQVTLSPAAASNKSMSTSTMGTSLNILQTKVETSRKKIMPRKLLPIRPSCNPTQLLPHTPVIVTPSSIAPTVTSTNFIDNDSNAASSVLVVQSAKDLQELVKSSNIPSTQDSFIQHSSALPYTGTLSRSLLPKMPSPCGNKESVDGVFMLKSSPTFFSHTQSSKSGFSRQSMEACDVLVSTQQSSPLSDNAVNIISTENLNCGSFVPKSKSIGDTSPSTSPQCFSADSHAPGHSHYMLLQPSSQAGTDLSVLMPINKMQLGLKTKMSPQKMVVLPLEGVNPALNPGELWNEKRDANVGREDLANSLLASPLHTLYVSSCNPSPNLSNISKIDSTTGTSENKVDTNLNTREEFSSHLKKMSGVGLKNASANTNSSEGQVINAGEVPGMLTFTSGNENQEPAGGGKGLSKENRGEDGGCHGDKESGGGAEGNANGERDRSEDGDGGRGERPGNGQDGNDKDGEHEEEEEDFDELTQDEDEEEVISSGSEESVLSVPELQETMEKLTWLASERRLCGDGDSEEENSPNSPTSPISQNSQEENSDDEEEGAIKGEELEPTEGEGEKLPEGDAPQVDDPPQISMKGARRGRGRARPPPRSLRKSRKQDRGSKDTSKLLLLCDDLILDNDPMRESKDIAYAQAYLNRVREALQDTPGKVEEFLSLLYEFEQGSESHSVFELFCQLKPLLQNWPELLRDFSAFLLPEQALECGLFEEQQAFERSRRFLRQLEISFGENPSQYQKIVKALQAASSLTSAGVEELKTQMSTLLKGHTHLQGEFSAFFEELRPPPAYPGQFEEATWPEEGGTMTEGDSLTLGSGGFEEVTLPDLEEEEETPKIPQITGKSRKRKEMGARRNYKACDWPKKHCPCHCHVSSHDAKHRRHKRKGCPRCHDIKSANLVKADDSITTPEPLAEKLNEREGSEKGVEGKKERETESKSGSGTDGQHHKSVGQAWERIDVDPLANPEGKVGEEEEEWKQREREQFSSPVKDKEAPSTEYSDAQSGEREMAQQSRQSPSFETPVCAKNISLTPSGEKVVLWTREADRVILTACQQQGASQSTFQSVSAQLGNKTANEVSKRFRDLMRLFHTSACQASSDEEATEQHSATDEEQD